MSPAGVAGSADTNRVEATGWTPLGESGVQIAVRHAEAIRADQHPKNSTFWSTQIAAGLGLGESAVVIVAVRGKAPSATIAGKPITLSYASTAGWRACAYSPHGPIGIDIEAPNAFPETDAMLARAGDDGAFRVAATELGWMPHERLRRIWTAKEAVLKGTGVGLRLDPRLVMLQKPSSHGCEAILNGVRWRVAWRMASDALIAIAIHF